MIPPTPDAAASRPGLRAALPYPVVLAVTVLASDALHAQRLPAGLIATLSFLLALGLTVAVERIFPHHPPARFDPADARWLAVTGGVQGAWQVGFAALVSAVAPALAALGRPAWGEGAPSLVGQVAVSLTLSELAKYTLHRAAHTRWGFWRFHAAHHHPAQVYALNGARMHPVNLLWNLAADALVPLALGLTPRAAVLLAALRNAVAAMQHADANLRLEGWNWIFSTPDLHHWHHVADAQASRVNYGSTLVVWDVLFGTRARPPGRPARYGLPDGDAHPDDLGAQLAWPWRGAAPAGRADAPAAS
ncbi:MAG: sterol desaturase family protein [Polyangiales bacterium]